MVVGMRALSGTDLGVWLARDIDTAIDTINYHCFIISVVLV